MTQSSEHVVVHVDRAVRLMFASMPRSTLNGLTRAFTAAISTHCASSRPSRR